MKKQEENTANEALYAIRCAVRELRFGASGSNMVRTSKVIGVKDVAEYFLSRDEEDDGITNMKLQKLVYYAQAFHLAIFDNPLFSEKIEAWIHGPVCPELYFEYKRYGSMPIESEHNVSLDMFRKNQISLLDEVNEVFGQYSAGKLRNMTHEDEPWKEMKAETGIIKKGRMMEFYKNRIDSNNRIILSTPCT